LPTIAYGQQVAVTGLQMALAYAAVANGGLLMKPMLVRARCDPQGQIVERNEPQSSGARSRRRPPRPWRNCCAGP